jgi:hypothetical protein
MTEEEWRPVPRFEGIYEVSRCGKVRRILPDRRTYVGRILTQLLNHKRGYYWVRMSNGGRKTRKTVLVHRIVCEAFHGPPPSPRHVAHHKDANRLNNHAGNLEWKTQSQNLEEAARMGTFAVGSNRHNSKLTEDLVVLMRERFDSGEPITQLARAFGINTRTAAAICRRHTWRHVEGYDDPRLFFIRASGGCDLIYDGESGFKRARGLIETGQGVGEPVIWRYLEGRTIGVSLSPTLPPRPLTGSAESSVL